MTPAFAHTVAPLSLSLWLVVTAVILMGTTLLWYRRLAREIARREAAEAALADQRRLLREAEETFWRLHDIAQIGVALNRSDGSFVQVNAALAQMTGYSQSELQCLRYWDIAPPDDAAQETDQLRSIIEKGGHGPCEKEYIHRDGRRLAVRATTACIANAQGEPILWTIIQDISARRQAEQALRAGEQRFRAIANYTYGMEGWYAPDGHLLWVSPSVERFTGYPLTEYVALADRVGTVVHPDDQDRIRQLIATALREHSRGDDLSYRICRKNREVRWVAAAWQPIHNEAGVYSGLRWSVRDITNRVKAEEQLRAQQALLQHALDALPALIAVLDEAGTILSVNQGWCSWSRECGFCGDTCLLSKNYLSFAEVRGVEDADRLADFAGDLQRLLDGEIGNCSYEHFCSQCEEPRWFLVYATRFRVGEDVRILVSRFDITSVKRAEHERNETEARFRSIFENANLGIAFADKQGLLLDINKAFASLAGALPEELLGRHFSDFTHPDDLDQERGQLQEVLDGASSGYRIEKRWVTRPGEAIWVSLAVTSIRDTGGRPQFFVCIVDDIAERRAFEERLQQAKNEAESASRAKSAFLANMSHELRTPLNAMLGYAQLLARDNNLSDHQRRGIETIRRSGDHLLTLIEELLDLARIEAGRFELIETRSDLAAFFLELEELFGVRAAQKGLILRSQIDDGLPKLVFTDEKRLRQILSNLLDNAIKFTEQGEIRLNVCQRGDKLLIEVIDTGIGIDPQWQDSIFKPFEQVAGGKYNTQGTGLGLAISSRLIEQMGGAIYLESAAGLGATFRIILPMSIVDRRESAEPGHSKLVHSSEVFGYRRTDGKSDLLLALIVDDLADNRSMLRQLLETFGFAVIEADGGQAGVDSALLLRPELVLMDLAMPGLDGIEATKRILAADGMADTVIIAVSARAFDKDKANSLAAGCRAHIVKPVQTSRFLRTIEEYLPIVWEKIPEPTDSVPSESEPGVDSLHCAAEAYPSDLVDLVQKGDIFGIRDLLACSDYIDRPLFGELREAALCFDIKRIRSLMKEAA